MAAVVDAKGVIAVDDPPITAVLGNPEAVFGVHSVIGTSSNTAGAMTTGEWLVGEDGRIAYGALCVFIDTAIGSPAVAHRPRNAWAVTTDLSITFCGAPVVDGSDLRSSSRTIFRDERSAVSDGEIVTFGGDVVAKAVERVVFTLDQSISNAQTAPEAIDRGSGNVITLLGGRCRSDASVLDVGRLCLNPAGSLHGGVAAFMSERAATATVDTCTDGLTPTLLQMSYIRPGRADSRLVFRCLPLHVGRNSAVVRVESRTSDDRLCTVASVSYHRR
ncbi:PaaI family thioesterase [Gordonia insulae]|uniref:Thioesterase domain-containing protein n=1 Tax=Gordonia insulae TaxID=2420509 RepID=A0A3G8JQZ0_9ACTN|nr:hotdog domain-containing protein [Gordonia insulae]AZG46590.1 hypothetical protein D7316_03191 [Gordonia insulae]